MGSEKDKEIKNNKEISDKAQLNYINPTKDKNLDK